MRRREAIKIVSLAAGMLAAPRVAKANPQHTGAQPGPAATSLTGEVWRVTLAEDTGIAAIASAPLIVNSMVVTAISGDGIGAFDLQSGTKIWKHSGLRNPKSVISDGQLIYVGNGDSYQPDPALIAYDLTSGAERWRFSDKKRFAIDSPIVSDGTVYLLTVETSATDVDCFLYAIDASTGGKHWVAEIKGASSRGPSLSDGVVYVIGGPGIVGFDITTGKQVWKASQLSAGSYVSLPLVTGSSVVYLSADGWIEAFSRDDGHRTWQVHIGVSYSRLESNPVDLVVTGDLLISSLRTELRAFNVLSGSVVWRKKITDAAAPLSVVGDVVYFLQSDPGAVVALNAKDGSVLFESPPVGFIDDLTSPAVADSWVVIESGSAHGVDLLALY